MKPETKEARKEVAARHLPPQEQPPQYPERYALLLRQQQAQQINS